MAPEQEGKDAIKRKSIHRMAARKTVSPYFNQPVKVRTGAMKIQFQQPVQNRCNIYNRQENKDFPACILTRKKEIGKLEWSGLQ